MHKASDHNTKRCEVEKWVFLPHSDFERLKANPYQEHEAITAARDLMYEDKNAYHCIMLLDEHGDDGLLIEAEGFDYPRLSMFVPDAALIYERYKTSEAELKLHDMIRDTVEKIVELAHTGKTDFTSVDNRQNSCRCVKRPLYDCRNCQTEKHQYLPEHSRFEGLTAHICRTGSYRHCRQESPDSLTLRYRQAGF